VDDAARSGNGFDRMNRIDRMNRMNRMSVVCHPERGEVAADAVVGGGSLRSGWQR